VPLPSPARQLVLAGSSIALVLLGLLPRAAAHPSQAALRAGAALIVLGLALDAYCRVTGALAATREPEPSREWAWACALGGSPVAAVGAARRAAPDRAALVAEAPLLAGLGAAATALALLFALAGDAP
jgi:hypothetical protein